jgi:transmembrane sensor
MDVSSSRLKYLLHSYYNGTATSAERQELMEHIGTTDHEEVIKEWIAHQMGSMEQAGQAMPRVITNERASQILSCIVSEAASTETIVQQPERRTVRLRWAWQAAAAVIILIAGMGSYHFLSAPHTPEIAETKAVAIQDIAPGGNRAVLQLANGTKIILDSARSGRLAQQGNANIVKLEGGKLAYSASNEHTTEVLYNSLSTPRGGQYQLTLPDGTRVWLDAESSIRYPTAFTGTERKVEIRGQAYFEVAKNEKMPFIVRAGQTTTTVLGTSFNINAYPDEKTVNTTLLEGLVKFSSGDDAQLLRPGQQAVVNNMTGSLTVRNGDTYQAVAWKNGQFYFEDMDLHSIMRLISRWYDVDIEFQSNFDGVRFGGGISRQLNLSNVRRLLDKSGVHTKLEEKKLIVLP